MYALNVGFMKSTDGGKTWTQLREPHSDNHDMWIDPDNPKRMIEANDGGANVSVNGGETWTDQDVPDGAVLPRDHDDRHSVSRLRRAAGQQHGMRVEPTGGRSGRAAATAEPMSSSIRSAAARAATSRNDPRNPDIFFAGSYGGLITRFDRKTGQLQAVNPYPDNPMGYPSKDIVERFQWTFPIVYRAADPNGCTSRRSTSGRRRTKARAGRGSAPI